MPHVSCRVYDLFGMQDVRRPVGPLLVISDVDSEIALEERLEAVLVMRGEPSSASKASSSWAVRTAARPPCGQQHRQALT
jgi:hypothetical protein